MRPSSAHSSGSGPHQGHLRVVPVKRSTGKLCRDGVRGAEIHHVEAAWRDDGGHAVRRCSLEPGRSGGENAAHQLVGPLRRRHVEDARDRSRFDERLHRASAGAGRVKHEDLVSLGLQALPRALDAGRRVAEHACNDERLRRALGDRGSLHHRADRPGGTAEDRSREAVEPRDIDDARHHHDVFLADVGRHVAAGNRRDHDLGQPEWQRPHGGGADRRSSRSAERQHPVYTPFSGQSRERDGSCSGHGLHHRTAVASSPKRGEIDAAFGGNGVGADVGAALRVSQTTRVHHQNAVPALPNALRREGVFQPLRIERSEHRDGAHDRAPPDARPNASISSRPSPVRRGPSVRLANRVTSAVNAFSVGSRSSELAP